MYAPLGRSGRGMGWKELNAGICRIMQDYCGGYQSEETLQEGLRLLREVREAEAASVSAANPHELAHAVECLSLITAGEAVIHASLAREASSAHLNFTRLDHPAVDPVEWRKHPEHARAVRSIFVEFGLGETKIRTKTKPYRREEP